MLVKYRGWIIVISLIAALAVLYWYLNREEDTEDKEAETQERRFIPMQ